MRLSTNFIASPARYRRKRRSFVAAERRDISCAPRRPGSIRAAPDQLIHVASKERSDRFQHLNSARKAPDLNPKPTQIVGQMAKAVVVAPVAIDGLLGVLIGFADPS